MSQLYCFGLGVGTKNQRGQWLEVFYPKPVLRPTDSLASILSEFIAIADESADYALPSERLGSLASALDKAGASEQAGICRKLAKSEQATVISVCTSDTAPHSVPSAYLKLHLLSHRLVKPHETDLSGIFGTLPNLAWTNQGPVDLDELPRRQLDARIRGDILTVECVDKFPKMTNYVVPEGVRIADTARVRLGAYLGKGTTIMHEGFVNFNAGTLGTSMIEGRISAGVVVGEGSDLGGGCSTMGTLSGGGNIIISIGRECLIGANAGVGIPLGDRCTVESGLYITAGTKIHLLDRNDKVVETAKAHELAGKSDLLFRRHSISGTVECKTHLTAIALNEELHANN
ncbi:MAG: 2,3,4,5-tetrahydropyridine-2-carboxylate N-succinyltransferase [Cellvibrionaceae bacterium]|jgi:2,3,4,5-tetrahydropyridine-2-carboxylate N-succinyltransferase